MSDRHSVASGKIRVCDAHAQKIGYILMVFEVSARSVSISENVSPREIPTKILIERTRQ